MCVYNLLRLLGVAFVIFVLRAALSELDKRYAFLESRQNFTLGVIFFCFGMYPLVWSVATQTHLIAYGKPGKLEGYLALMPIALFLFMGLSLLLDSIRFTKLQLPKLRQAESWLSTRIAYRWGSYAMGMIIAAILISLPSLRQDCGKELFRTTIALSKQPSFLNCLQSNKKSTLTTFGELSVVRLYTQIFESLQS